MGLTRNVKNLLALSLVFILLGAGNLAYGHYKQNAYMRALSKAKREMASPERNRTLPLLNSNINIDKQEHYIQMLRAHISFYEVVSLGGKCFLALAGILLAASLVSLNRPSSESA